MQLILDTADMFLITDPASTLVPIPHLIGATRTSGGEVARVRFEGDRYETEFGGEGEALTWALTARFGKLEHAGWKALRDLFDTARAAPDRRLGLRTHTGQVPGLDDFAVVTVSNVTETAGGARAWDLTFTAAAVAYQPA